MKRLIEELFPVENISASCRREKSIRQGHISTLQTWWARRPLAVCRATIFLASLPSLDILSKNKKVIKILSDIYPDSTDMGVQLNQFISEMSDFGNSNNKTLITAAREIIALTNSNPSLADTFAGGGSIPLEAIRLGLKTQASDLNPIATVGLKLALTHAPGMSAGAFKRLHDDIESVASSIRSNLASDYPSPDDLAYFWSKTYQCRHCKLIAPLFQNKWLSKGGQPQAVRIAADKKAGTIQVAVYEPKSDAELLDADSGTVASKSAKCLFCNEATNTEEIMRQGIAGSLSEVQYATLTIIQNKRIYSAPPQPIDLQMAIRRVAAPRNESVEFIDLSLALDLNGIRHLWAIQYGIRTVFDLFNPRQQRAIQEMTRIIAGHRAIIESTSESKDEQMFRYRALLMIMNKVAIYSNRHSWWQSNGAFPANIFVRQAISMVWNYVEIPPCSSGAGGWHSSSKWIVKALDQLRPIAGRANVNQQDAAETTIPERSLDLVVIDPPYFDSITYAYLSDFFYPWTKKLLQDSYPAWFEADVTPKAQELIVDRKHKLAPSPKSGSFFAEKMTACLNEARRTLTTKGLIVLMYGHKELAAWIALFEAIKNSGLRVSISWPIQTERQSKFQHSRVDALGVSCILVLRQTPIKKLAIPVVNEQNFRSTAVERMNQLKAKHPELIANPVALSMAVFPLVLDDYMHCEVIDSKGIRVGIDDLIDSVNL
jgi:adenine-specific DNA methylase